MWSSPRRVVGIPPAKSVGIAGVRTRRNTAKPARDAAVPDGMPSVCSRRPYGVSRWTSLKSIGCDELYDPHRLSGHSGTTNPILVFPVGVAGVGPEPGQQKASHSGRKTRYGSEAFLTLHSRNPHYDFQDFLKWVVFKSHQLSPRLARRLPPRASPGFRRGERRRRLLGFQDGT